MYIVTHKFTQHVKKNQFFFLRGIILPLSPTNRRYRSGMKLYGKQISNSPQTNATVKGFYHKNSFFIGVTIHFSFDLNQQISNFLTNAVKFENHGMSYLKIAKF
jgi:hypothetical protein